MPNILNKTIYRLLIFFCLVTKYFILLSVMHSNLRLSPIKYRETELIYLFNFIINCMILSIFCLKIKKILI